MSGPVDNWNIVQASLEANRIKGVQHAEFQNIQGFLWIRMNREQDRKRGRVGETEKTTGKMVAGDTAEKTGRRKGRKQIDPEDPRGGVLDTEA